MDRLAILALGGLRLQRIGVHEVHVQRAGERERRLDVVGVGVARDVEAARLEGREERLVVEFVGVRQTGRARVAVEDDVVDVGQILRVRGRQLELGEVVARRIDRAECHHRSRNAPGVEEQGDGGDQVERARGGRRPAGRSPGNEQADADQERPGADERPLAVQDLRRRIPRVAVAEEGNHQHGGQQRRPVPVAQRRARQSRRRPHAPPTARASGPQIGSSVTWSAALVANRKTTG